MAVGWYSQLGGGMWSEGHTWGVCQGGPVLGLDTRDDVQLIMFCCVRIYLNVDTLLERRLL